MCGAAAPMYDRIAIWLLLPFNFNYWLSVFRIWLEFQCAPRYATVNKINKKKRENLENGGF